MNKIIFIGKTGCGKTSLCQAMHNEDVSYNKTQQVVNFQDSIDTPGEFLESRILYDHLVSAAVDAGIVCFVQSAKRGDQNNYFPPLFTSRFQNKKIVGVVTKIDAVDEQVQIDQAESVLKQAGVTQLFDTSVVTKKGLDELFDWFKQA
ncbi:MAG: EutP/PduV family microcompartment system protein [Sporolactobacillus sp.]